MVVGFSVRSGPVENELVGLFDIVTHPRRRRRGHAGALIASLLDVGRHAGATDSYLQVVADNAPAIALYDNLGFSRLYDYWYRSA